MRLQQVFHPFGRVIEALGEEREFVGTRLLDAHRQVALAPALHALAQVVQPVAPGLGAAVGGEQLGALAAHAVQVAEALQRVPGVTVIRSAARDDVMHYSAEPSGVVIRGLQQVRSEFNGRDSFSATSGYGLSWSDVSPELMAGVDTYKNQTAEMIEGGIAGTVNLRTRKPFDQSGRVLTLSATQNYGDIGQRATPDVSGLFSDRWSTGIGEFGLLVNAAYSQVVTRSQGITTPRMMPFAPGVYEDRMVYIPSGIGFSETDYDRKRFGIAVAGQWKSNEGNLVATAQYNRSSYKTTWVEHQLLSYWTWVDPANTNHSTVWTDPTLIQPPRALGPTAPNGTPFTFREDGLFQTGTITTSRGGWGFGGIADWATGEYVPGSTDYLGVLPNALPLYQPCLNTDVTTGGRPCRAGSALDIATRYSNEDRVITDASFNLIWQATDRLMFNFDYQRVKATNYNYDITFNMRTWADIALDLRGATPQVSLLSPSGYNTTGADWLTNPNNYTPASAMDHITDSTGQMDAFRLDGGYNFESPWLSEIRFGGRYANRQQEHQWSVYNWQSITSDWQTNPAGSVFANSGRNTIGRDGDGNPILFEGYGSPYWDVRPYGQQIFGGHGFLTHSGGGARLEAGQRGLSHADGRLDRAGRDHGVHPDLLSRPGPRMGEVFERVAAVLHPVRVPAPPAGPAATP